MTSKSEEDHRPASEWGHSEDTGNRRYKRYRPEDASRWEALYRKGNSIVQISAKERVNYETVAQSLHRLRVEIKLGRRPVQQPPLRIPARLVALVGMGRCLRRKSRFSSMSPRSRDWRKQRGIFQERLKLRH